MNDYGMARAQLDYDNEEAACAWCEDCGRVISEGDLCRLCARDRRKERDD